ncbi:MAG: response regulator [Deltaproteobacteria bacterium]|nr:response regulator [Deltaproteobacteria bacterium]
MKALIVDDSKVMIRIISGTVEMLGLDVVKVNDGKQALDFLETGYEDISIILLDWNMPVMNGFETLEAIKKDERFSHIPVMMVTTEGEQSNVIKALKAGAEGYLTKPFNQQDLAVKIMETMGMGI